MQSFSSKRVSEASVIIRSARPAPVRRKSSIVRMDDDFGDVQLRARSKRSFVPPGLAITFDSWTVRSRRASETLPVRAQRADRGLAVAHGGGGEEACALAAMQRSPNTAAHGDVEVADDRSLARLLQVVGTNSILTPSACAAMAMSMSKPE